MAVIRLGGCFRDIVCASVRRCLCVDGPGWCLLVVVTGRFVELGRLCFCQRDGPGRVYYVSISDETAERRATSADYQVAGICVADRDRMDTRIPESCGLDHAGSSHSSA